MNKLMAVLLLFGALGSFGLSQRSSFESQNTSRFGAPVGEVRTVKVTSIDRMVYLGFGAACLVGAFYFIVRIRNEDARK